MLCLSKKTEYALIALAFLAENGGRVASAREISAAKALPLALLMNILKTLQSHGLLSSTRGVKGGYLIALDLYGVSLEALIAMVDCAGHSGQGECGCLEHAQHSGVEASHGPVEALQWRLAKFLKDVRVADLVLPGRRIDVPVERLTTTYRRLQHADHVD